MPIVPLKQTIIVERAGKIDEWGGGTLPNRTTFKARVDEGSKLAKNQLGQEVVSNAQIFLNKLADIRYDDTVEYKDELGRVTREKPIRISTVRNYAGKAILTEVML